MRHVLVHDYANIDDKELYNTAVNDIPALRKQVEKYLVDTDWGIWASLPDDMDDSEEEKLLTVARKMKIKGYSVDDITDITGLSKQEIEEL